METPYTRLAQQIITSDHFDSGHRRTLKGIIFKLSLDEAHGVEDVNLKIQGQVDLEVDIVYLLGEYEDKVAEVAKDLELEESSAILEVPKKDELTGYKASSRDIRAHLATNPEVAVIRQRLAELKSLYGKLERLAGIVFRRNAKIEHLSNNYRRELRSDSHSY